MTEDKVNLILDAIHTLRQDLTGRMDKQDARMDKQDESQGKQWETINAFSSRVCPEMRHLEIDARVKSLELDRAKVLGVVIAVTVLVSIGTKLIETVIK